MKPATEVRDHLVRTLGADLVGPFDSARPTEILEMAPSRWYLTGFIAPQDDRELDSPDDVEQDLMNALPVDAVIPLGKVLLDTESRLLEGNTRNDGRRPLLLSRRRVAVRVRDTVSGRVSPHARPYARRAGVGARPVGR